MPMPHHHESSSLSIFVSGNANAIVMMTSDGSSWCWSILTSLYARARSARGVITVQPLLSGRRAQLPSLTDGTSTEPASLHKMHMATWQLIHGAWLSPGPSLRCCLQLKGSADQSHGHLQHVGRHCTGIGQGQQHTDDILPCGA